MSDSIPPKKHSAEGWGLLFTIAVTAGSGLIGYGILKERVDTLSEQYRKHDERLDGMQRDKTIADKLEEMGKQLVRVETQLEALRDETKDRKKQ